MQGSNDAAEVRGSSQETAVRKTAEHTVKHHDGGVGSVVANRPGAGESSVVVTTLINGMTKLYTLYCLVIHCVTSLQYL